jgi:2-amino-1-hydroxyethylphosphonate dioxygenase (glycine-forming)
MNIENLFNLYNKYGKYDYIGEDVSQIEHMIQAAMIAEEEKQSTDVILACFLHDIGHLIGLDTNLEQTDYGVLNHEFIGSDYLRKLGFKYPIPELVENHVKAKKYLTFKNPDYYNNLSNASKQTLKEQGGPMTKQQAENFENDELFEVSLKMRIYDEKAKIKDMKINSIDYYFDKINKYLLLQTI